ncbi:MAG: metallophosphoesterase [Myxococcales bacterium]|nr:metallophosphoesterase [Myxococcales bacterium]
MFGAGFFLLTIGLLVAGLMRWLHPSWWQRPWIRRALVLMVAGTLVMVLTRQLGLGRLVPSYRSPALTIASGIGGGIGVIWVLSLLFTVPLAGIVRKVLGFAARRKTEPADPAEPRSAATTTSGDEETPASAAPQRSAPQRSAPALSRRTVLETAAAAIPASGLGLGAVGVAGAFVPTAVVPRPLSFSGLPDDLAGLKILQLTDVHLGAFMDPSGVVDLVERARETKPDLVVLTGDICDHLPWLEAALRAVETLDPRLGLFAVMGNHEHYRGSLQTRRSYAKTRIELLDDTHRVIRVGSGKLVVSGVDDPVGRASDAYFERAIDRALSGAPSDAFHLGLSHRPSGFVALSSAGVDLTLSGHTHGAQVGFGDRSLLEPLAKGSFLRGTYDREGKRLYTSSGAGHWLAFRLDCPSEAALITLEKA